jgi:hypothetical protein
LKAGIFDLKAGKIAVKVPHGRLVKILFILLFERNGEDNNLTRHSCTFF